MTESLSQHRATLEHKQICVWLTLSMILIQKNSPILMIFVRTLLQDLINSPSATAGNPHIQFCHFCKEGILDYLEQNKMLTPNMVHIEPFQAKQLPRSEELKNIFLLNSAIKQKWSNKKCISHVWLHCILYILSTSRVKKTATAEETSSPTTSRSVIIRENVTLLSQNQVN